jgi:hypothetical protein
MPDPENFDLHSKQVAFGVGIVIRGSPFVWLFDSYFEGVHKNPNNSECFKSLGPKATEEYVKDQKVERNNLLKRLSFGHQVHLLG